MRSISGIAGLVLLFSLPSAFSASAQRAQQGGYALVIGNTAYAAYPPLSVCRASAQVAASALGQAGFAVSTVVDPSNAQLGQALGDLSDKVAAQPNSRAVAYYCGYITPFAERLFLLPVDAQLERPSDVLASGIVARLLMGSVLTHASSAGLVLMDAAVPPGERGVVSFASMLRPGDAAHGGLAAAELPGGAAVGPIAAALPAMLAAAPEMGRQLAELAARPEFQKPGALAWEGPATASMLLEPPPAAPPPPAPAQPVFRPPRPSRGAR